MLMYLITKLIIYSLNAGVFCLIKVGAKYKSNIDSPA